MQKAFTGTGLSRPVPARAMQPFRAVRLEVSAAATEERLRLHNLSPQKGSRRDNKRKGRGYGGHQV
jgi:large subunit ribosomal protein L15